MILKTTSSNHFILPSGEGKKRAFRSGNLVRFKWFHQPWQTEIEFGIPTSVAKRNIKYEIQTSAPYDIAPKAKDIRTRVYAEATFLV